MRIHELTLEASHLPQLSAFYADAFGLPVSWPNDRAINIQIGETRLTFAMGNPCRYHFAINIPRNQFEQGKRWLADRVPLIPVGERDYAPFPAWDANAVYFFDPGGNVVELIARQRLNNASDTPFGPGSLLAVSEIGIATTDVQATSDWLCNTLKLPVFDGKGSDVFTAIGDDNGLLIVVPCSRQWYPDTGVHAELYPVDIVLDTDRLEPLTLPEHPYTFSGRFTVLADNQTGVRT